MRAGRFRDDERGVASTVSYTLAIGITIVLVAGLVFSMGGLFEDQRERAIDAELRTITEGIATELVATDRAADRVGEGMIATRIDGPALLAGQGYSVSVDDCDDSDQTCIEITTVSASHTVAVNLTTSASGTSSGGTMWIVVTDGELTLAEERPG